MAGFFGGRKGFVNQVSWNQFEDLRNFRKGSKKEALCKWIFYVDMVETCCDTSLMLTKLMLLQEHLPTLQTFSLFILDEQMF